MIVLPSMKLSDKFRVIIPPQDIACEPGVLDRLADGDRDAYGWVYKNYCEKVFDYAMLMTGNEAMSEDMVQEVFLKVWQHRKKLKVVEDFNGYLYILYRNHILDAMKRQQKETSVRHEYYKKTKDIFVDDCIGCKETQQAITKAVQQLPQQRQLVYTLGREYGWTREEIANKLNVAQNTVKAQMQQALRFLKTQISEF